MVYLEVLAVRSHLWKLCPSLESHVPIPMSIQTSDPGECEGPQRQRISFFEKKKDLI